ncbi:hypothetical protein [Rickettsia hoogstraalii]|nr:hypothetical protein [Rickettsia hoogstraalii]
MRGNCIAIDEAISGKIPEIVSSNYLISNDIFFLLYKLVKQTI